ncbi:hypothetical protein TNCT_659961 [Trichonephila clavata]|uniref:Uncharacterized protein n=1 Tax=Trichonephila clavata TaxID=2740835 RepID=A0A8X6FQ41_TRICU|nr:hypothetical protein TNCT_659961 [Trichonephila clavata]
MDRINRFSGVQMHFVNFFVFHRLPSSKSCSTKSIGPCGTAFDDETSVIMVVLQQFLIRSLTFVKLVILSDSKVFIQAIASHTATTSLHVLKCRELIYHSLGRKKFTFPLGDSSPL